MIAKKAFSILASLGMALTVTVPAYAEETEIQAKGYTDVGYTVLDEWLGPTGTYPARHISGFDLTFAGEPEGVEPGDFTVIDEEYEAAGTFDNGVLTVSAAAAEGNTVKLTIPADKASTAMAYTGGLDFRRRKVSYRIVINNDIKAKDGKVLAAAGDFVKVTQDEIEQIGTGRFEELVLTSDNAGNNIYLMVSLPENYDENGSYPHVFHVTGGGQQYKKNQNLDPEIYGEDNFGVGVDCDYAPYTFATQDEDTIVVTFQSIGQRDLQPEGYSYSKDVNQAVEYFLDNYAVDSSRVYAVGNSMGGNIMSEAVAMRPDLYAAYVPCNTSIVMGTQRIDPEDTENEIYQKCLSYVRSYISEEVAISFNAGRNDPTGSWASDQLPYQMLVDEYKAAGYTDEQISELVQMHTYEDEDFHAVGSHYYHGATGLMCLNKDVLAWVYRQQKPETRVSETANDFAKVYGYSAAAAMTYRSENGLATPTFLVYPDGQVSRLQAEKLLEDMGIFDIVDEENGAVYVINPAEAEYSSADAEAFVSLLDVLTPMAMNTKLIGIGSGSTFISNELNEKLWSVAGLMLYGGEEGKPVKYAVPAYISGTSGKAYTDAADAENEFEKVIVSENEETLGEAFANAWKEIFVKNGRVGNITGTFYTKPTSIERPFEYFSYLDCASMGIQRTVVDTYDFDGDGIMNLWYEYLPEATVEAPASSVPMVLLLHGNTNDPRTQANTSGWPKVAAENGIILVEPEWQGGMVSGTQIDAMTEDDSTSENNDIIKMLDVVLAKYPQIDASRIYVEGLSRGSVNSINIALTNPDIFAAVGAHSAGTMENFYDGLMEYAQASDYEVPIFFIAGDKDQFYPLPAKGEKGSVFMALQLYQVINGLEPSKFEDLALTEEDIDFGLKFDEYHKTENAGTLDVRTGELKKDGRTLISMNAVDNWGHWNYEPAAALMWDFFKDFTKDAEDRHPDILIYDRTGTMDEYSVNTAIDVPTFIIYPDEAVARDDRDAYLEETGIKAKVDELGAKAVIINPIDGEYGQADADAFLSNVDTIGYTLNLKVIGFGKGATFVNKYVSKLDWAVAGIMAVGGEAADSVKYSVPAYVSGSDAAAYIEADKAEKTAEEGTMTTYVNPDNHFEIVVANSAEETPAEAFANAWDTVLVRNGKVGNITGTWYTQPLSRERQFEYFTFLNLEALGLNRNVVSDVDMDGDGLNNLWYEYYTDAFNDAEAGTVPVVVMLHGNGNDPRTQATTSGWAPLAAEEGILLIEAEHQGGIVGGTEYDAMSFDDSMTKENGIIDMIGLLKEKYPQIDENRIYVEGLSKGSVNSIVLGIMHPEVFAAAGGHSAGIMGRYYDALLEEVEAVKDDIDTPLYLTGGTKDTFPMIEKGENGGALLAIQLYEMLNELPVTTFDELSYDNSKYLGMVFDEFGVEDTEGYAPVYSGKIMKDGKVQLNINAIEDWGHWNLEASAELMWDFFKQHTLNENVNGFFDEEGNKVVLKQLDEKLYWFENGEQQGVYGDPLNIWDTQYDRIERGREIYDPETDAWYWLDANDNGAVARDKEVWMPYIFQGENPATEGKWVRYDKYGQMVKGWYANDNGVYYYDL
ncbi:MAG: prolyl oligopeptidase family serine peptidase, partial [Solobacterium sp.]|nr:prolyl oligopeptidase family serine peptidase [Solobacterium sp.]